MKNKFELAPGWKSLFVLLGISVFLGFGRTVYGLIELLAGYFFGSSVNLLHTIFIVFFSGIMVFIAIYCGFLTWFFLYRYKYECLSLSDNGFEYQTFGFTLCISWINVKRIKSEGLLGLVNGIYVIPDEKKEWFKSTVKSFTSKNTQGEMFIPLSIFDVDWRDAELGQQIKQYAPHLFQ